jgi:predicted restriction endonuclease
MSNQSKACDITPKVRATVLRRDSHRCIYCHTPYALQLAHVFYNRSHGGLGVVENLVTLCIEHHCAMDNGKIEKSKPVRDVCESYLRGRYYGFDFDSLKYKKGE